MNQIFNDIVKSFSSLWQMRIVGNSIEIVTPCATSNNYFVSLFLSKRGNEYVVSDGGWVHSGIYECEISDGIYFTKLLQFYIEEDEIKSVQAKGTTFYYKKTTDVKLIPNLVFDLSNFVSSIVSASFIKFQAEKEIKQQQRFTTKASGYLRDFISPDYIAFNKPINYDNLSAVKFNAIITKKGKISLLNMVTGSDDNYFINSIGKSSMKFEIIEDTNIPIENKITIVDSTVKSFTSAKIGPYLNLVNGRKDRKMITWDNRESLKYLA